MDSFILYPSLFVGAVLIVIHLTHCHRRKRPVNLAVMTNAVLTGSGVVCGVLLIVGSFDKTVMDHLTGINVYIFIAGVAVCYVSAQTINKDILQGRDKDADKDNDGS